MKTHEFLFGDKFERCVEYICVEAYKKNTRKAYQEAAGKLHGIRTLCVFISSEGVSPMPSAILMLQALDSRLSAIIRSEKGCLTK